MAFALHASRPDVHVLILVALAICTCHGALGSTSPPLLPPPGPYQYVRSTRQFYGPKGAFSTDVYTPGIPSDTYPIRKSPILIYTVRYESYLPLPVLVYAHHLLD